jgi:G:T/U-mismatch repair DNA glycosylase
MITLKDKFSIEDHQFDIVVPSGAKHLIIGTFHTHPDNFSYPFYYSGKENMFWVIMGKVFDHRFSHPNGDLAAEERKRFLLERKIGITDMIKKCYRRNHSSSDTDLFPIILNDILSVLDRHSAIDTLIFTSRTEVFGALGLFKTFLLQKGLELMEPKKRSDRILEAGFARNGRNYKILVPYSPSPRLLKENRTTLAELVSMYKTCLSVR